MTRFVSTRYPELRVPALGVRFRGGVAEVVDPVAARKLAQSSTEGVRLADGEQAPQEPGPQGSDADEDDSEPPARPADSASKDAWRSYVLATVDVTEDEVRDFTKADLIQLADAK